MLILTRKTGESLYIGDDIKISIVEVKGHQIRIGIEAPRDCRVYREEIYLAILEENKKAAEMVDSPEPSTDVVQSGVVKACSLKSLSVRKKNETDSAIRTVPAVKGLNVVVRKKRTGKSDE